MQTVIDYWAVCEITCVLGSRTKLQLTHSCYLTLVVTRTCAMSSVSYTEGGLYPQVITSQGHEELNKHDPARCMQCPHHYHLGNLKCFPGEQAYVLPAEACISAP